MKKLAFITAVVALSATILSSCGSEETFVCDSCNKEVTGKKITVDYAGAQLDVCEDCNEEMEAMADLFADIGL